MNFIDYTWEELRRLSPSVSCVFVPLGCVEQQGPHLTVGFDARMITRLCADIASELKSQGVQALVMPTLPFGPTPEHRGFGQGYVNLRQATHEAVVEDILESLVEQGFGRLLVWRGCGQHNLANVVDRFNLEHPAAHAWQPVLHYGAIAEEVLGQVPGGHADSFATSVCLYLDRSQVREGEIRRPEMRPFEWSDSVDFAAISNTGVIGDPTHSSAEAGARLWQRCVQSAVEMVLDILSGASVRQTWRFIEDAQSGR